MELPATGYLRIWQILGDAKRGIPPLLPISTTAWWAGIRAGRYPQGVRIGARATGWRVEDVRRLLEDGVRT